MKILFLGTPDFVRPVKEVLQNHFTLTENADQADLIVVAAYGQILSQEVLDKPKFGSINIHPSLLPKYRGASPIQSALLEGDTISGITIIKMDKEVDHGPIIYQEEFNFREEDNFDTLSKKMFLRASEVLPQVIEDFVNGKIKPRKQDHSKATFCTKLTKDSGYFDINNSPTTEVLQKMIKAYYPWPGVWTKWNGKIVKFLPARNATHSVADGPNNLIQMEGKKPVSAQDFKNGYPDFPLNLSTN